MDDLTGKVVGQTGKVVLALENHEADMFQKVLQRHMQRVEHPDPKEVETIDRVVAVLSRHLGKK